MTAIVNSLKHTLRSFRPGSIVRTVVAAAVGFVVLGPWVARGETCAPNCQFLSAQDATDAVRTAATAISPTSVVIAVVDRSGVPLAVYLGPTATAADVVVGNFGTLVNAQDYAVGLARTGAFFSNDQAPLSSRTVRYISGIHFAGDQEQAKRGALRHREHESRLLVQRGVQRRPGHPAGNLRGGRRQLPER